MPGNRSRRMRAASAARTRCRRSRGAAAPISSIECLRGAFRRTGKRVLTMVHYKCRSALFSPPRMKFGVVIFPGSNCDHDAVYALSRNLSQEVVEIWHRSEDLCGVDVVFLPGGFSYGDYLRCGAIARFSPVMRSVKRFAASGGAGHGSLQRVSDIARSGAAARRALMRNRNLRFICKTVRLSVATIDSPFTNRCRPRERARGADRARRRLLFCRRRSARPTRKRRPRRLPLRRREPERLRAEHRRHSQRRGATCWA